MHPGEPFNRPLGEERKLPNEPHDDPPEVPQTPQDRRTEVRGLTRGIHTREFAAGAGGEYSENDEGDTTEVTPWSERRSEGDRVTGLTSYVLKSHGHVNDRDRRVALTRRVTESVTGGSITRHTAWVQLDDPEATVVTYRATTTQSPRRPPVREEPEVPGPRQDPDQPYIPGQRVSISDKFPSVLADRAFTAQQEFDARVERGDPQEGIIDPDSTAEFVRIIREKAAEQPQDEPPQR